MASLGRRHYWVMFASIIVDSRHGAAVIDYGQLRTCEWSLTVIFHLPNGIHALKEIWWSSWACISIACLSKCSASVVPMWGSYQRKLETQVLGAAPAQAATLEVQCGLPVLFIPQGTRVGWVQTPKKCLPFSWEHLGQANHPLKSNAGGSIFTLLHSNLSFHLLGEDAC